MKPLLRTCALLLSLVGPILSRSPALAQAAASADELFNRGIEQMTAGNYEAGCKDIGESHRIEPLPGTLFTLATCMDRWGHVATAVALYGEYLAVHEALPDERKARQGERPKVATERRKQLGPEVPELTLMLPAGAPAGIRVERDGQEITAATLGVAVPVDPGEHVVTTRAPGGQVSEQRIAIGTGEKKKVALEVKTAPAEIAPPRVPVAPPVSAGSSDRRKAAYALGGVGVAGLALGGVMGGLTLGEKGTVDQHCGEAIMAPKARCDSVGLDAADRAKRLGLVSTISMAVGLAGLGAGVVLLVTESAPAKPKVGARSGWIVVEVLSTGPDGAMLGARGAF